ncbi:metal-dependent hydrolase [Pseudonocardia sp. CA-107938]|uniref:metal-dependent hydrolase n=1 Tax=Pseudonocardia sp. CA-107938 TaxID=3240021 RepID=UPI003D93A463
MTHPDAERVALGARDVQFDWSTLPVHWIPGRPFATHLVNVMHLLLPEGEHWFVRLFSEALPLIRDPHLAEDVRGFIGQEAMHAAAHESVHTHFASHGIDPEPYLHQVEFIFREALGDRGLDGAEGREWLVDRLAVVAAIEHLTAFLGDWILHADALDRAGAHPTMLDLLRWHGAEEVEHRSVAHDLYMHLDGSYLRRLRMLTVVAPMLLRLWAAGVTHLMAQDVTAPRPRWSDLLRTAAAGLCPGPVQTAWSVVTYVNPRYHPSQHGSTDDAVAYLAVSPAARAAEARADTGRTA